MGNELTTSKLTTMQRSFLDFLAGEARGDLRLAKDLAGYSSNTLLSEIVRPLREHIIEIAKDLLAYNAIKATFVIDDVLNDPSKLGAANAIKAAEAVMDRAGVLKNEVGEIKIPQGAIFILPAKNSVNVIETSYNTIKEIEPKLIDQ